jgi:hypothetical protein
MTQNNLGTALTRMGERLAGAEGARRLEEAVAAYRAALTVYTREALPQDWAMTQNNLGTALTRMGEREGGTEGARRLAEAVEAYRQALTVRTRDALPGQWAATQHNLGATLQVLVKLSGFAAGLEQVDRLSRDAAIRDDPAALAPLLTLAIVCQVGTGEDGESSRTFASLVALVERQPDDFHLAWDWDLLRTLIQTSETVGIKARRDPLLRLLDAVSRDDRRAILDGLKRVQGAFPVPDTDPKKEHRS